MGGVNSEEPPKVAEVGGIPRRGRDPETSAGISDFLPRSSGRGGDAGAR